MKKKLMLVCFIILISANACAKTNTSVKPIETTSSNNTVSNNVDSELVENEDNDIFIPKWLSYFSELKQDTGSIYLNEDNDKFELRDNRLMIPESNILIVAKEIGGRDDISAVEQANNEILDIIKLLKETDAVEETDMKTGMFNPNAYWLDFYLDVVFLTVDGEYYLMQLSICHDNIIYVDIIRNIGSFFSFYIQSPELYERIKSISGYLEYDLKTCGNIKNIQVKDSQNNEYTLSEEELKKMKEILGNTHEKTDRCAGPYDIRLIATQDENKIYMKWCNDDCRIIVIEGIDYIINENDAEWLRQMLSMHGLNIY